MASLVPADAPRSEARRRRGDPIRSTLALDDAFVDAQRIGTHDLGVAELAERLSSGVVGRCAARLQIGDARLEVKLNLVVDVALRITPRGLEPTEPTVAHRGRSSVFNTLATASTNCDHVPVSALSC